MPFPTAVAVLATAVAASVAIALAAAYVVYRIRTNDIAAIPLFEAAKSMRGRRVFTFNADPDAGAEVEPVHVPASSAGEGFTYSAWVSLDEVKHSDSVDAAVRMGDRYWLFSRGTSVDETTLAVGFTPGANELVAMARTTASALSWRGLAGALNDATAAFARDAAAAFAAAGAPLALDAPPLSSPATALARAGQLAASRVVDPRRMKALQADVARAAAAYGAAVDRTSRGSGWVVANIPFVPLARWVHVAVVCDGATLKTYVDGSMAGKATAAAAVADGRPALVAPVRGATRIGCTTPGGSSALRGRMANLRFYTEALSRREVGAEYARGPRGGSWLGAVGLPAYGLRWPIERRA